MGNDSRKLPIHARLFGGEHVTINFGRNASRNRGFTESRQVTGSKLSESREDAPSPVTREKANQVQEDDPRE